MKEFVCLLFKYFGRISFTNLTIMVDYKNFDGSFFSLGINTPHSVGNRYEHETIRNREIKNENR